MSDRFTMDAEPVEVTAIVPTLFQQAEALCKSSFVPAHFRNKPENAMIAVNMANRMGMDPYAVMKGLYDVHGTLGMTGAMAIAMVNATGKWGPIRYEITRDAENKITNCRAYAKHLATAEVAEIDLPADTIHKEGWATRNPHWKNMPEQMFRYRAAAFWARLYCPEALFGLHTVEEINDTPQLVQIEGDGRRTSKLADIIEPSAQSSADSFDLVDPPPNEGE